jgi:hypothetical protein
MLLCTWTFITQKRCKRKSHKEIRIRGDKPVPSELEILRMPANKADKLIRKITPTQGSLIDPPNC